MADLAVLEYDCNYSDFDLHKHIQKYPHYLEVVIDEAGKVHYAHPSHQRKLIAMACKKLSVTQSQLSDMCPENWYFDFNNWLCLKINAISVYTHFFQCPQSINIAQSKTLRRLKESGAYEGELINSYGKL